MTRPSSSRPVRPTPPRRNGGEFALSGEEEGDHGGVDDPELHTTPTRPAISRKERERRLAVLSSPNPQKMKGRVPRPYSARQLKRPADIRKEKLDFPLPWKEKENKEAAARLAAKKVAELQHQEAAAGAPKSNTEYQIFVLINKRCLIEHARNHLVGMIHEQLVKSGLQRVKFRMCGKRDRTKNMMQNVHPHLPYPLVSHSASFQMKVPRSRDAPEEMNTDPYRLRLLIQAAAAVTDVLGPSTIQLGCLALKSPHFDIFARLCYLGECLKFDAKLDGFFCSANFGVATANEPHRCSVCARRATPYGGIRCY